MQDKLRKFLQVFFLVIVLPVGPVVAEDLAGLIEKDYEQHLGALFEHFHRNPELSFEEFDTAARLAQELRMAGFTVTEGVGGTGIVALLENGAGPMVMMRADMDGLPLLEKSGLPYASLVTKERSDGSKVSVMHACGHDVHITSLAGTARLMASSRDTWSGTLMLIGQPAEEQGLGSRTMMEDHLWERFGQPDFAMGFHVSAGTPVGKLEAVIGSPNSGSDSVDIIVHGIGAHGASPHQSVDPVVLGAQIVLALQTVISREKPPREAGVITVGSFHAGTRRNIIPDQARLELTVRNDNLETRHLLLDGIRRVAENMGRVAGLPEELLPEVIFIDNSTPPIVNNTELTRRMRSVWSNALGDDVFVEVKRDSMHAEDFSGFTTDPYIPSTYFGVGGTSLNDLEAVASGGAPVSPHHSPLFRIEAEESVRLGVQATVLALRELLQDR